MDFQHIDWEWFVISIIVLVCSITLHEFGHAISADRLGDDTPRRQGRINLWPDKHFDPLGFAMLIITSLVGFGIAWGKPVQVNPRNFRHPNRDMMIVTACGPLMNLLLALVFGLILRFIHMSGHDASLVSEPYRNAAGFLVTRINVVGLFLNAFTIINLALMYFNLIPIPPLDGSKILYGLLPFDMATRFERFMGQYGSLLLIVLLVTGATGYIIRPAMDATYTLIVGQPPPF